MWSKPARVAIVAALTVLLHLPVAGADQAGGHGDCPAAIEAVYVGSIGGGPLKGHFRFPRGIAVDEAGRVFVADNYCRVQVFDADGGFLYMWGAAGEGPGQFRQPVAIALDQAGLVYVADALNARIQVFTREGVFVRGVGFERKRAGPVPATRRSRGRSPRPRVRRRYLQLPGAGVHGRRQLPANLGFQRKPGRPVPASDVSRRRWQWSCRHRGG